MSKVMGSGVSSQGSQNNLAAAPLAKLFGFGVVWDPDGVRNDVQKEINIDLLPSRALLGCYGAPEAVPAALEVHLGSIWDSLGEDFGLFWAS